MVDPRRREPKTLLVGSHFTRQAHCQRRASVEGARKCDDRRTSSRRTRKFHCVLDTFGPGGKQDCLRLTGKGSKAIETLAQRDVRLVRENLKRGMDICIQLTANGFENHGVPMPRV